MSDTPHPDPLDEQASDLLDAGADAPGDEPELGARLDDLRRLRVALADVPPPDDAQRDGALAAALSLFDELAAETEPAGETDEAGAEPDEAGAEPAPVTPLRRPARRRPVGGVLAALAAAVVLVLGIGALVKRGDDSAGNVTAARPGLDDGFSSAKAAGDAAAPAPEAATAGGATAGGSAAEGGSSATSAAAATTAAAAGGLSAASTTAATAADQRSTVAAAAETTSTTDVRDVTTTSALEASTTSPPTTTSTNVDAGGLPYLGSFTRVDDIADALRQPPAFDATDEGSSIRTQLADGVCDLRPFGTPVAVLRWNGRDSVAIRSADAPIVQVIPLDGCNPVAQLDAPS